MKLLCHAFDATLNEFGIKEPWLAEEVGISAAAISSYRNDTNAINTDGLEKMLAVLSDEAFSFWISQIIHCRNLEEFVESPIALSRFVQALDNRAAAELLSALAAKLRGDIPKQFLSEDSPGE